MEIEKYIDKKKEIYDIFLEYIESDEEEQTNYLHQEIIAYINILKQDRDEVREMLKFISEITKHHYRTKNFFNKAETILSYVLDNIKQTFSKQEIFDIFKNNKRILLYLFKTQIITIDTKILTFIHSKSFNNENQEEKSSKSHYDIYFYPEIKDHIGDLTRSKIEQKVARIDSNLFDDFELKRLKGENESYLCELIRNDMIVDFISFVTKKSISLNTLIEPSVFETNPLLTEKSSSLIEYAAFYGSIQIFQYLKLNNIKLDTSLWFYSIHGKNAEIIHMLEESKINPPGRLYRNCLKEAIKNHHNEIANYFYINIMKNNTEIFSIKQNFDENIIAYSFHYHNYFFFPNNLDVNYVFFYLCQYNYINLVKLYMEQTNIDVNCMVIFKNKFK